jgi:hypothetical protein
MKQTVLLAALLCLRSVPVLAESWTGALVDSNCYASEEGNVNPFDPPFNVNHDRGFEIRACRPSARTKSFAVVDSDGQSFKLDPSGNAKAAELVRQAGKKSRLDVMVTGEKHKDTVRVNSISLIEGGAHT